MFDELSGFRGRSALVTGHTGFKGSWLALWLHRLGAHVVGYALDPPSDPNHFEASDVAAVLAEDVRGDIRDRDHMVDVVGRFEPEIVFHLAAQPFLFSSFGDHRETFE